MQNPLVFENALRNILLCLKNLRKFNSCHYTLPDTLVWVTARIFTLIVSVFFWKSYYIHHHCRSVPYFTTCRLIITYRRFRPRKQDCQQPIRIEPKSPRQPIKTQCQWTEKQMTALNSQGGRFFSVLGSDERLYLIWFFGGTATPTWSPQLSTTKMDHRR